MEKLITMEHIKCMIWGVVMKDSYNLIDFIKMYYLDSNIPMYLFEGGNCIFCMPKQTDLTYPPEKYTEELLDSGKRISYCTTKYGIFFLFIEDRSSEKRSPYFRTGN